MKQSDLTASRAQIDVSCDLCISYLFLEWKLEDWPNTPRNA